MVKVGKLDPQWGKAFDRIFENRQLADYLELVEFEESHIEEMLRQGEGFVADNETPAGCKRRSVKDKPVAARQGECHVRRCTR